MLRTQIPASLALLTALTACGSVNRPAQQPENPVAGCQAEALPGLLGEPATAERVELARQQSGARSVRVLAPGDAVTLDYDSQRLNIDIDEAELIQRVSCG